MSSSPLPPARVVRSGDISYAPPGTTFKERCARFFRPVLTFLGYAVALAPLTAIVIAGALAILAISLNGSPYR
jgi:hypothetical protein